MSQKTTNPNFQDFPKNFNEKISEILLTLGLAAIGNRPEEPRFLADFESPTRATLSLLPSPTETQNASQAQ
jgi:hypothetical protein